MKLRTESGRVSVSLTQVPGLGSGTLLERTGSQAEEEEACSLNLLGWLKAAWISSNVKEQMAEPIKPLVEVVKVP